MNQFESNIQNALRSEVNSRHSNVTFAQIWNKYSEQKSRKNNISFSRLKVAAISLGLVLVIVIPVSAAILPIDWNGVKLSILDDRGLNADIDAFKEKIYGPKADYKTLILDTLEHSPNVHKTLTVEEAQKEFPFEILRPLKPDLNPTRSIGVYMNHTIQKNNESEEINGYTSIFHDFYEINDQWIVVTQSLNQQATDLISGKVDNLTETFAGNWDSVSINDNLVGLFIKDNKENRLVIQYKTTDHKVLDIKIIGNVTKEELIKVSKLYLRES